MREKNFIREIVADLPRQVGPLVVLFSERIENICARHSMAGMALPNAECQVIFDFYKNYSIMYGLPSENIMKGPVTHKNIWRISASIVDNKTFISKSYTGNISEDVISAIVRDFEDSFGIAQLDSDEKSEIHFHISNIRTLIGESELSDRKKNALFERLNWLALEVDQLGTRTDRFFAFLGDVASVAGEMTKKAKPLVDEVKDMIKIIGRARARHDQASLPSEEGRTRLPPPNEIEP